MLGFWKVTGNKGPYILPHKNKNSINSDICLNIYCFYIFVPETSNLMVCQHLPMGPALGKPALLGLVQTK